MPSATPDTTTKNRRGSLIRRAKPRDSVSVPVLVRVPDFTAKKEDDGATQQADPQSKTDVPEPTRAVEPTDVKKPSESASQKTKTSTQTKAIPGSPMKSLNQLGTGSVAWQFIIGGALLGCFVLAYILLSNSNDAKPKNPDEQIPAGGLQIEYPDNLRGATGDATAATPHERSTAASGSAPPHTNINHGPPTPTDIPPNQNGANGSYPVTDPKTYPSTYQPLDGQDLNAPRLHKSANAGSQANSGRGGARLTGRIETPSRLK